MAKCDDDKKIQREREIVKERRENRKSKVSVDGTRSNSLAVDYLAGERPSAAVGRRATRLLTRANMDNNFGTDTSYIYVIRGGNTFPITRETKAMC